MSLVRMSSHAQERAAQRCINTEGVLFVMKYGRVIHSGEAVHYYLGRRDIPERFRHDDRLMKLEGTTLVTANDGTVITFYKNKNGSLHLRRKSKWHRNTNN